MKLNKLFKEVQHEHRGNTDRIEYVLACKASKANSTFPAGSLLLKIEKAKEGGWTFLGRHFNSIQGAKKEARKYCNERASEFSPAR